MATYTEIPNSDIETDKPIRAVTGRALRDNPIAIAGGAIGAPRNQTGSYADNSITEPKLSQGVRDKIDQSNQNALAYSIIFGG